MTSKLDKLIKVNKCTYYTVNDYIYAICFMEFFNMSYNKYLNARKTLANKTDPEIKTKMKKTDIK